MRECSEGRRVCPVGELLFGTLKGTIQRLRAKDDAWNGPYTIIEAPIIAWDLSPVAPNQLGVYRVATAFFMFTG